MPWWLDNKKLAFPRGYQIGTAPHLDVIPAREVELFVVEPPRHVDVHAAYAVVIVGDGIHHFWDESGDIGACGIGEVLADRAAAVRESVWEQRGLGVQQQPRALAGARGDDHDAGIDVM